MEFFGSDDKKAIWAMHYAQVKANINQPKRTHEVTVNGKNAQGKYYSYQYKYADLADVDKSVMDAIRKVTDDKGQVQFSYFFDITNAEKSVSVKTILIDICGVYAITNEVWFRNLKPYDAQDTAKLISYAKRYSLSAAFGVASEDDDDAQNIKTYVEPKILTNEELKEYTVEYDNGVQANLMELYEEAASNVKEAQDWLHRSHSPQDAQAIHQIAVLYKKRKRAEELAERRSKKKDQEEAEKDEALKKIKEKSKDVSDIFKQSE